MSKKLLPQNSKHNYIQVRTTLLTNQLCKNCQPTLTCWKLLKWGKTWPHTRVKGKKQHPHWQTHSLFPALTAYPATTMAHVHQPLIFRTREVDFLLHHFLFTIYLLISSFCHSSWFSLACLKSHIPPYHYENLKIYKRRISFLDSNLFQIHELLLESNICKEHPWCYQKIINSHKIKNIKIIYHTLLTSKIKNSRKKHW